MEDDTLYSVKWYKGRREFFRYTPKEKPSMKIFSHPGINVDQSESNESHVLLTSVSLNITGKFSCEVSADAPTFHTAFHTGEMEVVGKLYRTQGDLLWGSNISILFGL
uniref:Ig-like domain-containing protein n=1 Tax=Megaselia scalaris TaxID=36166 RepID=T1GF50_MEGSC